MISLLVVVLWVPRLISAQVPPSYEQVQCKQGVFDCQFTTTDAQVEECTDQSEDCESQCAPYNNEFPEPHTQTWVMVLASIVAAAMAFGIGANDAANSWATSVGSRAINIKYAVVMCGLFEWLGATTLGFGVSKTIQKGVSDISSPDCWACGMCDARMSVYQAGMFGALCGASVFLMIASYTALPVSTTHAIVGGVVGMTMAGAGTHCINWSIDGGLGGIVLSWVISPALSGILGFLGYYLSLNFIIKGKKGTAKRRALILLPCLYVLTTFVCTMLVFLKAKAIKKALALHEKIIVACCIAAFVGMVVQVVLRPRIVADMPSNDSNDHKIGTYLKGVEMAYDTEMAKKPSKVSKGSAGDVTVINTMQPTTPQHNATNDTPRSPRRSLGTIHPTSLDESNPPVKQSLFIIEAAENVDQLDAIWVFKNLLIFNACLESFAHGSNDTANSTGAFSAVYQTYKDNACTTTESDVWILSVAGIFVAIGVCTFGYRVIQTLGTDITMIDYHKGFYIELASTLSVMAATLLEFPVSTTHCQVGAIIGVGLYTSYRGEGKVEWGLLLKIFLGWVITLPIAGGVSAIVVKVSAILLKSS